jgi:hypothetical protein
MYYHANYQQLNHDHVGGPRNHERVIRHVSKVEVSCDNISSVSALSDNSFYRSNHVESQCGDRNIVMKLVSPHRDSSSCIARPHYEYEDHLIARYSQHQISSPSLPSSNNLQAPQFRRNCPRFTPPQRSPPFSGNRGGHASSPEPSVSPPTGVDRSSSNGSCVSSLSEPVAGVGNSNSRRLTSYHRKKKILDLEDGDVNVGAFTQR